MAEFGVNQSLLRYPNPAVVPLIAGTGATWVRVDVPWFTSGTWPGVEGQPGVYNPAVATAVNALAAQCASFGMSLLISVGTGVGGGLFGSNSVSQYAAMMGWLASQCPGLHWEILNEPDLRGATTPALYASVVKATFPAMKTADPTCTVVAGAIAVPQLTNFMAGCYTAGMKGSYDVLSIHTYDQLPSYPVGYDPGHHLAFNVGQQQKLMVANSDTVPLWITEFGWPSDTISQSQQAQYIVTWLAEVAALNIPVVMQFNLIDGTQPWGLVDSALTPKAAYRAVRAARFA